MKKLIGILLVLVSLSAFSQTRVVSNNSSGFKFNSSVTIKPAKPLPQGKVFNLDIKPIKSELDNTKNAEITSNTAIYKAANYDVYTTSAGKMFIIIPNTKDTGFHRKYLKTD